MAWYRHLWCLATSPAPMLISRTACDKPPAVCHDVQPMCTCDQLYTGVSPWGHQVTLSLGELLTVAKAAKKPSTPLHDAH